MHIHRLSHEAQQLQTALRVRRALTVDSEQLEPGSGQVQPGKDEFHVNNATEFLVEVSVAFFTPVTNSLCSFLVPHFWRSPLLQTFDA